MQSEPVEAVDAELNVELGQLTCQSLMGQIADMSLRLAQKDVQIYKLQEALAEKNKIIDAFGAEQAKDKEK